MPEGLAGHAVAADAALAAEEAREHQRHGPHQLAHAQRDHGEGRAGLLGGDVAQQHREHRGRQAPATSGSRLTGSIGVPSLTRLSVWIAKNEPRPEYTAWPKLSMPPCPSSMLKARQAMMAMPICDSMVSDRLLVHISGATISRISA
jgi:hypothetical protein